MAWSNIINIARDRKIRDTRYRILRCPLFPLPIDNTVIVIVIDDVVSRTNGRGWIDGISSGAINATPRYQVERTEVDKVNCETPRCLFVVSTVSLRSLEIFNRLYLDRAAGLVLLMVPLRK